MTTEPARPTISARRATSVGLASLLSAASGYVALLIAARVLDVPTNSRFLTYWSLLFWVFGALGGLQNEITRAVWSRAGDDATGARSSPGDAGARVFPVALAVGGVAAVLVGATSPLWGRSVLGDGWGRLVLVVCVAVVAFAGHLALCGALAGRAAWNRYATLVAAESSTRILLVAGAALAGAGAFGPEAGAALAAASWTLLVVVDRRARAALPSRADVPLRGFLPRVGHAIVASTASSALVVGFTVMLSATTKGAEFDGAAPFILAIALTRAPLLIPLNAYQGVAIAYFLDHRASGLGALRKVSLVIVAGGLVVAAAAAAAGPWLMRSIFGPEYRVSAVELAALTLAAALLALLTLTGAAVLAHGDHRRYAAGWALATVVSLGVLLLPLAMEPRAILSLAAAPLAGVVLHAAALRRPPSPGR